MAPVEIETIPRDVVSSSPMLDTMKNVATPDDVEMLTPMSESGYSTIETTAEEKLIPHVPEGTTADMACAGLDQLTTTEVPAPKETTPETSKEAAVSYFGYAKEYMASFSFSQIVLKLGDKGLQITTDAVKLTGLDETGPVKPVMKGIEDLRRHARAVRRAGAKVAGIKPAKTIGEASLVGAVAEIFGLNFFLSVVGLQLIPANVLKTPTIGELDTTAEEETVDVKLSDEKIAGYKSDEDPNFVPRDASEDSAEDDYGEEKIEEEKTEETTEKTTQEKTEKTALEKTEKTALEKTEETSQEKTEEITEEAEKTDKTTAEKITEETTKEEIAEENIEKKSLWERVVEITEDVKEIIEEKVEDVMEKKVDVIETVKEKVEDIIEKDVIEPIEAKIDDIKAGLDVSGAEEADELD